MNQRLLCSVFSEKSLARLEAIGKGSAKILRQIMLKVLDLRRNPKPQDCKKLENYRHQGMDGYRVDQGEYRVIYSVDEKEKKIFVAVMGNRSDIYEKM